MKPQSPVLEGYPVAEFKLGHGSPGIEPHPVVRLDETTFLSRWRLTPEELEEVARTGEIFIFHGSIEKRFLPVRVQVGRPEFTLPVLRVELGHDEFVLCHGIEVSEAGGSEEDRQDLAAAEAAGLIAARAALPARAALIQADVGWMEAGGQVCATRDELEAALCQRLRMALDAKLVADGDRRKEKRVEVRGSEGYPYRVTVEMRTPRECSQATEVTAGV